MFEWSYGLSTPKKWWFIWRKSSQTWLVGLWKILINRQIVAEILLARTGIWQFDDKNEWFTVFKTNKKMCANRYPLHVGNHRNSQRMHIHQVYDLQRDGRCKHVARNEDRAFAGSRSLALRILTSFIMCVFFLWGKSYSLNVYLFFGDEKKTCFLDWWSLEFRQLKRISAAWWFWDPPVFLGNQSCSYFLGHWGTCVELCFWECFEGMLVEDRR